MISQRRSLFLGLSLVLAACGGDGLTLPPDGAAAGIEVMSGNGQSGRVGSTLADSLVVRVTDTQDRPVAGAEVVFDFTADGSTASPATVSTDADGTAWSRLAVGTRVGPVSGVVSVPVAAGVTPVQATISATALAANANGIALVSGDDQSGAVGSALAGPLVVAVGDEFGNPIPNVTIEWTVDGGGSVSPTTTLTGSDGQASVTRTLGPTAGEQATLATAAGLAGSPVTFTHIATPGSATGVVKISGDGQSALAGTALADPLVVQVLDAQSNPIAGRAVTWIVTAGGGQVPAENTITDGQGFANTPWTLGPSAGANSLNAVVSGVGTATFTATGTAGVPSGSASSVSASSGTITAGTGTSTITVTVRDAGNNPVAGAAVTPASSGTENTFNPTSATSGSNGVATFTFSSTVAESKTITATAGGVAITDQATVTVQKAASETEIESDEPDESIVGQSVRVVFTVEGSGGIPTGQVTVTADGGDETCSAAVAQGFCDITFMSAGANRRLTATYEGDTRFASSFDRDNHQVEPAAPASTTTTITTDDPDPSDAGVQITVTFTVTSLAGTPTGDVQVTDPLGGSCAASASTGSCQYTPGGTGTRTITATYEGSALFGASSDTEEHTVTPPPANTAPTALNDQYVTPGLGQPLVVSEASQGVLNNDSDPDLGDVLSAVNASDPPQGSVTLNSDGTFTYTPDAGASGTDSFTYDASDGSATSQATVTITITP